MQKQVRDLLRDSVALLIIDSDPLYHTRYRDLFSRLPVFSPMIVSDVAQARQVLQGDRRIHLIITELDTHTDGADEFTLLREYAGSLPCMVVSSRDSLEKGFRVGNHGALAIELKPLSNEERFLRLVARFFLDSLLTPGHTAVESDYLRHYIAVFNRQYPLTAGLWAERSGLPLPFLNRNWERTFKVAPGMVACLHALYRVSIAASIPDVEWPVPATEELEMCLAEFSLNEAAYRAFLTTGNPVPAR